MSFCIVKHFYVLVFVEMSLETESPGSSSTLAIHCFSGKAFHAGIEKHLIDGVKIKVYSPEKTLADCFKFRNKIGMDVVLEALKLYRSRKKLNMKISRITPGFAALKML